MKPQLTEHINQVEAAIREGKALLGKHGYPDDLRTVIVIGLIDQMREHHDSLLLLIRSNLVGSAFTLARSIFESLYRGLWFNHCATDIEIEQFEKEDKLPRDLTMAAIAKVIDSKYGFNGFYEDFKKRAWAAMCSYTHTGLLQLGRRFTGNQVQPAYSDEEIFEVTTTATTCVLLLAGTFLAAQNHAEDSQAAKKIIESYGPVAKRKPQPGEDAKPS